MHKIPCDSEFRAYALIRQVQWRTNLSAGYIYMFTISRAIGVLIAMGENYYKIGGVMLLYLS